MYASLSTLRISYTTECFCTLLSLSLIKIYLSLLDSFSACDPVPYSTKPNPPQAPQFGNLPSPHTTPTVLPRPHSKTDNNALYWLRLPTQYTSPASQQSTIEQTIIHSSNKRPQPTQHTCASPDTCASLETRASLDRASNQANLQFRELSCE